jgi:hypothetical protein
MTSIFTLSNAPAWELDEIGSYDSLTLGNGVAVQGNYAYVIDAVSGLEILDISNPTNPSLVGSYNPPWMEYDLCIRGDKAYIGSGSSEPYMGAFSIVDISDPDNPSLLGSASFNWEVLEVEADGNYAYAAVWNANYAIDNSNPSTPSIVDTFDTPGNAQDFLYREDRLYVADGGAGLTILSLSDPAEPQLLGNCPTPGWASAVALSNFNSGYAFVACLDSSLRIIDVSNASDPTLVAGIRLSSRAWDIDVSGSFAYVATEDDLTILRIENPLLPRIVTAEATPEGTYALDYEAGLIHVISRHSMQIFLFSPIGCHYIPGDINGDGQVNGLDIVYNVNYLKGGIAPPADTCDCGAEGGPAYPFFAAMDVNGSCTTNGIDITYFVAYLKGGQPLQYCPSCPPIGINPHAEFRGDCLPGGTLLDNGYMILEVIGDDLHVHHMEAAYQCCLEYFVRYEIAERDITAFEYDIGPLCDCICDFNLESVLYDLSPGNYRVRLIGVYGDTVGVDSVTVGAYLRK